MQVFKHFAQALPVLFILISTPDNLHRYTDCKLGQFDIVEVSERDQPFRYSVQTSRGELPVDVAHGISLHIALHETPFVNFKAERLGNNYAAGKSNIIENMRYLAAQPGMETQGPSHVSMNGLDAYGVNRKQMEGGVLSVYVLFRDVDQTVVTLYILNTPPEAPQFHTMDEYRQLRDAFLNSYTRYAGSETKVPFR